MGAPAEDRPSAAFGLALAGGIIIILVGLVVTVFGALFTLFVAGVGGLFGLIGVVWGILIIVCANRLRSRPEQHVGLGVAIILFSIFSWFGAFGGLVIGFLLALIGGILAIVWKPGGTAVNVTVSSASTIPPAPAYAGASKFCPNCGAVVEPGSKFCRNCGRTL